MARPTNGTKILRPGTWGTQTSLMERIPIPAPLYHGGQVVAWGWHHRRGVGWSVLFVVLWSWWGFVGGLLGAGIVWGCLTGWILWRRAATEGTRYTAKDFKDEKLNRARLARSWPTACRKFGLINPDTKQPAKLRDVVGKSGGTIEARVVTADVVAPESEFVRRASDFASVFQCQDVVVAKTKPGEVRFTFHWRDQMGRTLPLADLPIAPLGRVAYGYQANGKVASVKMNLSLLIGGITESGKSSVIQALTADLLRQQVPMWLYISDTKGREFREYAQHVGTTNGNLTVKQYVTDPKASEEMVKLVCKNMETRARMTEGRDWKPSAENPLVVLIVDEFMDLHDTIKNANRSDLATIIRKGRAVGYTSWLGTQSAIKTAMGDVRDLVPQRIAMATRSRAATEAILGDEAVACGAMSHEIRDDQPGTGYTFGETDRTSNRIRAAYVKDDDLKMIAAGTLPPQLIGRTRDAIGEVVGNHALYRWFNDSGELLYVGITNDVGRRTDEHAEKEWWSQVASSQVEWFPSRKAALDAEKRAIIAERPLFNVQHNGLMKRPRLKRKMDVRPPMSGPRARREAEEREAKRDREEVGS